MSTLTTHYAKVNAIIDQWERTFKGDPEPEPDTSARDFAPLVNLVGEKCAAQFMYMGDADALALYKHIDTRRYLNIDRITGDTYKFVPAKTLDEVRHGLARYEPIPIQRAINEALSI